MKNVIKNQARTLAVISALFVLGLSTIKAQTIGVNFKSLNHQLAAVKVSGVENENVELKIKNSIGITLETHKAFSANQDYIHVFNLSDLKEGDYSLLVSDGDCVVEWPFFVEEDRIVVKTGKNAVAGIHMRNEMLTVSMLNASRRPVEVSITNNDGLLVYEDTSVGRFNFQRQYDLSHLEKGEYLVTLTSGSHKYTELVTLNRR